MPGYGVVVIVDHGRRYYSLYGRLAVSLPQINDVLEKGGKIGSVGKPDQRGRNFYFEIRKGGKAIDPSKFFASALNLS